MASPRVVALTATTGLYLLALAAWLGGLMAFAALLVPRNPPGALERVSPRFSRFAGLSVLALTVAGTAQHLIAGTATTRSGVLLLVEGLALVATLLLCRYAVAYGRRLAFRERYMRGFPVEQPGRRPKLGRALGVQVVLSAALLSVAVSQLAVLPVPDGPVAVPLGDPSPTRRPTAREARPAAASHAVRTGADRPARWRVYGRRSGGHGRQRAGGPGGSRPRSAGGMGAPTSAIRTGRP